MHPDCESIRRHARRQLSEAEAAVIAAHLSTCAACAREADDERWLVAVLRLDDVAETSPEAMHSTLAQVGETLRPGRARALRRVKFAAFAVVGIAVCVAGFLTPAPRGEQSWPPSLAGISPQVERDAALRLTELRVLAENPWIADDYATLVALRELNLNEKVDALGEN